MSYWARELQRLFGISQFPDDYLAFDYETTGFEQAYDLPIDFGYTLVRGGKPITRKSFILDWTRVPKLVDPGWLYSRLERVKKSYANKGEPYHYSVDRLRREGKDPFKVIKFNFDLFTSNRKAGAGFVGHNAAYYDCAMAKSVFLEYLGEEWVWGGNEVFDTGAMEKALECARKLDPARCVYPEPGESMFDFFIRSTRGRRPGILWNVKECVKRYGLDKTAGIDLNDLHGAETDSYVCHLLMENFRHGKLDTVGA